jgi:hypothetical protein
MIRVGLTRIPRRQEISPRTAATSSVFRMDSRAIFGAGVFDPALASVLGIARGNTGGSFTAFIGGVDGTPSSNSAVRASVRDPDRFGSRE